MHWNKRDKGLYVTRQFEYEGQGAFAVVRHEGGKWTAEIRAIGGGQIAYLGDVDTMTEAKQAVEGDEC